MIFRQLLATGTRSLAYLVADAGAREAVAIDAVPEQHAIVLALLDERDLRLRWVLRTHSHAGVDDGSAALSRRTGATLAGGASRARPLADGDTLAFGGELLRVIACPGHTPDSVGFQWRDRLFSGDAIEIGGCGHEPLPDADPARLYDSVMRKLFVLPDDTIVYPGHALHDRRVSTIGEERTHNRCFSGQSRDAFVAAFRRLHRVAG